MNRVYNFNAGPCTLPLPVLETVCEEFLDYAGAGMSLVEMSHRSPEYDEVHMGAMALVRELLGLPEAYKVLFLGGGATLQFAMVPMNLLPAGAACDFALTGSWSKKAYADATRIGSANAIFDGKDDNYLSLPEAASLQVDPQAAYLHLTANETIGGLEWWTWPDTGDVPIVCDMSSDFLSRRVPVEKFGLIYAGAQKNVGPAGVTVVLIRQDLLERCPDDLPAYLSYKTHADKNSLYNTPPVFAIYMMKLVLQHLRQAGGLAAAEQWADERSGIVYGAIQQSGGFYTCPVREGSRSKMNVVFRLPNEELEKRFVARAAEQGLIGLKGHRSVGGCRASIYNAMPTEGARALAGFMGEFAAKNG